MVRKFTGIDQLIPQVLSQLGEMQSAFVTGDYARGIDSGIIDLVIVGKVDELYLKKLIDKAEGLIHRKIRFLVLSDEELEKLKDTLKIEEAIPLWGEKDSDE